MQFAHEFGERSMLTFRLQLDIAGSQIANPAVKAERLGAPQREIAESNALDPTLDHEVNPVHGDPVEQRCAVGL